MRVVALVLVASLAGCLTQPEAENAEQAGMGQTGATFDCPASSFRAGHVNVTFVTDAGDIQAVLYGGRSPLSVCNFLQYVEDDYYDGTVWHRVCAGFVIQAGGFDALGSSEPARQPIKNEAPESKLRNVQGSIAMARTAEPDSATTHFFINLVDNLRLDYDGDLAPGYAVFGNVTGGWGVVEEIASTPVVPSTSGCEGRPIPTMETTIGDIAIES